jgi:putative DNA primase/helicase
VNGLTDRIAQFENAMRAAGIGTPRELVADGRLYRFCGDGDRKGAKNAWYCLFLDGDCPAGAFGSWRLGIKQTWCADGPPPTAAEIERARRILQSAREKAEAERQDGQQATAEYARRLWHGSEPADPAHPYLVAKAVQPHGLRQRGETLFIPLGTLDRELWNLQRIAPDGQKRFLKGGRVTGLASPLGELTDPARLIICEGWATAATLHETTGLAVLAAMNAGNLRPVAMAARERWPGADLIIAADNDRFTRLPDGRCNPGMIFAKEAAAAAGARLMVPEFPEGCTGTDFNDLRLALKNSGVTEVTDVTRLKTKAETCNACGSRDVTGVTGRSAVA